MHLAKSLTRASAFTTRSIREESRLLTHHLLRGGIALSILIALFLQGVNSVFFGAAGLRLYSSICFLVYWFLTIAGTLYFSLAIAEEKDEGTLPLLQMTGVSDFALLLGKSIPRLAIVFLIQLVILPFSILSITLGGLTPGQLIASQICLLCYSFLLCEIGLLAGTVARSGTRAFQISGLIWFLFEPGYFVVWLLSELLEEYGILFAASVRDFSEWLHDRSLLMSLEKTMHLSEAEPLLQPQCFFHLTAGCLLFLISWVSFRRFTRTTPGASGEGVPAVRRLIRLLPGQRPSRRVNGNALSWKTKNFVSGGRRGLILRTVFTPLVAFGIPGSIAFLFREPVPFEAYATSLWLTAAVLGLIDLCLQTGRVLNEEVFRQTISSLVVLPTKTSRVVISLLLGIIPSVLPHIVWFIIGVVTHISEYRRKIEWSSFEWVAEPWAWHFLSWVIVTLSLGLYLSTQLRYGGILIAIAVVWFAGPFLFMMFFGVLTPGRGFGMEIVIRHLMPLLLMISELVASWWLFRMTIRKLITISETA